MGFWEHRSFEQKVEVINLRLRIEELEQQIKRLEQKLDERETPIIYWNEVTTNPPSETL